MKKISGLLTFSGDVSTLRRAIKSMKVFDELVVVDRTGSPEVAEIVAEENARLIYLDTQTEEIEKGTRNAIVHSLKHEWIFFSYSDEVITRKLSNYVKEYVKKEPPYSALYIPRKNYLMHRFIRSTYPDYRPRLFRRDKVLIPPRVEQFVVVDGPKDVIPAADEHLAILRYGQTFKSEMNAINLETDVQADTNKELNPKFMSLMFSPFGSFMNAYLMRGGWRYGSAGFIRSCMEAHRRFLLLTKIYEQRHESEIEELMDSKDALI